MVLLLGLFSLGIGTCFLHPQGATACRHDINIIDLEVPSGNIVKMNRLPWNIVMFDRSLSSNYCWAMASIARLDLQGGIRF